MILNISGRTDIVAFYTPWLMNRFEEGFIDVRNPIWPKKVSRIYMKDVDALVFCTKNPKPIIPYLEKIKKPILFQVTITPYKDDIEVNVNKKEVIENVKKISEILGSDRVYVRYDPFFLSDKYSLEYHAKAFQKLTKELQGYVKHFIFSFLDDYKNVCKNQSEIKAQKLTSEDIKNIGLTFAKIAKERGMTIQTCGEKENLEEYGFLKRDCLDLNLAFALTGKTKFKKWNARKNKYCHCVEMVDIGSYNSCPHLCKYCYANFLEDEVRKNYQQHNKSSSLLIGNLQKDDEIVVRKK